MAVSMLTSRTVARPDARSRSVRARQNTNRAPADAVPAVPAARRLGAGCAGRRWRTLMNPEGTTRYRWLSAIDQDDLDRPKGRFAHQKRRRVPGDVVGVVPPLLRESGDVYQPSRPDADHAAVPQAAAGAGLVRAAQVGVTGQSGVRAMLGAQPGEAARDGPTAARDGPVRVVRQRCLHLGGSSPGPRGSRGGSLRRLRQPSA